MDTGDHNRSTHIDDADSSEGALAKALSPRHAFPPLCAHARLPRGCQQRLPSFPLSGADALFRDSENGQPTLCQPLTISTFHLFWSLMLHTLDTSASSILLVASTGHRTPENSHTLKEISPNLAREFY